MNAKEARQLTVQAKNKLLSEKEADWLKLNKHIVDQIVMASLNEHFEVRIDMKI